MAGATEAAIAVRAIVKDRSAVQNLGWITQQQQQQQLEAAREAAGWLAPATTRVAPQDGGLCARHDAALTSVALSSGLDAMQHPADDEGAAGGEYT